LRRRVESGLSTGQRKLPRDDGRAEIAAPGPPAGPPAQLRDLLAAHLRHGDLEPVASQPGEIVLSTDWYDYEAKYAPGGMELVVPARISEAARERVRELAVEAFRVVGASGLARVDFFVDGDDVLVNELNTMPGFTETSVYAALFAASGVSYPELLSRLVALGLERYEQEQRHKY